MSVLKTESKAILKVSLVFKDDGEFLLKCPHCARIRGICDEFGTLSSLVGEQYQCDCDGWFEIGSGVSLTSVFSEVELQVVDAFSLYDCDDNFNEEN